tara:strand:- start:7 stop:210 length:204 start_codon:yes stop_codon:yes gene_type:complete
MGLKELVKYIEQKGLLFERLKQLKEEEQEIISKFPAFGIMKSDEEYLKEIEREIIKRINTEIGDEFG